MDVKLKDAIMRAVEKEPIAREFNMQLVELETGQSAGNILNSAGELSNQSAALRSAVDTFLSQIRAG